MGGNHNSKGIWVCIVLTLCVNANCKGGGRQGEGQKDFAQVEKSMDSKDLMFRRNENHQPSVSNEEVIEVVDDNKPQPFDVLPAKPAPESLVEVVDETDHNESQGGSNELRNRKASKSSLGSKNAFIPETVYKVQRNNLYASQMLHRQNIYINTKESAKRQHTFKSMIVPRVSIPGEQGILNRNKERNVSSAHDDFGKFISWIGLDKSSNLIRVIPDKDIIFSSPHTTKKAHWSTKTIKGTPKSLSDAPQSVNASRDLPLKPHSEGKKQSKSKEQYQPKSNYSVNGKVLSSANTTGSQEPIKVQFTTLYNRTQVGSMGERKIDKNCTKTLRLQDNCGKTQGSDSVELNKNTKIIDLAKIQENSSYSSSSNENPRNSNSKPNQLPAVKVVHDTKDTATFNLTNPSATPMMRLNPTITKHLYDLIRFFKTFNFPANDTNNDLGSENVTHTNKSMRRNNAANKSDKHILENMQRVFNFFHANRSDGNDMTNIIGLTNTSRLPSYDKRKRLLQLSIYSGWKTASKHKELQLKESDSNILRQTQRIKFSSKTEKNLTENEGGALEIRLFELMKNVSRKELDNLKNDILKALHSKRLRTDFSGKHHQSTQRQHHNDLGKQGAIKIQNQHAQKVVPHLMQQKSAQQNNDNAFELRLLELMKNVSHKELEKLQNDIIKTLSFERLTGFLREHKHPHLQPQHHMLLEKQSKEYKQILNRNNSNRTNLGKGKIEQKQKVHDHTEKVYMFPHGKVDIKIDKPNQIGKNNDHYHNQENKEAGKAMLVLKSFHVERPRLLRLKMAYSKNSTTHPNCSSVNLNGAAKHIDNGCQQKLSSNNSVFLTDQIKHFFKDHLATTKLDSGNHNKKNLGEERRKQQEERPSTLKEKGEKPSNEKQGVAKEKRVNKITNLRLHEQSPEVGQTQIPANHSSKHRVASSMSYVANSTKIQNCSNHHLVHQNELGCHQKVTFNPLAVLATSVVHPKFEGIKPETSSNLHLNASLNDSAFGSRQLFRLTKKLQNKGGNRVIITKPPTVPQLTMHHDVDEVNPNIPTLEGADLMQKLGPDEDELTEYVEQASDKGNLTVMWSEWSPCSASCGNKTTRRRTQYRCINGSHEIRDCEVGGELQETCTNKPCPVNGGLSRWSEFSQCSRTCGGGVRKRHRQCNHPEPRHGGRKCNQGDMEETRSCGNIKCINILKGTQVAKVDPKSLCEFNPCEEVGCLYEPAAKCIVNFECNPVFFDAEGNMLPKCKGKNGLYSRIPDVICNFNPCRSERCWEIRDQCVVDFNCRPVFIGIDTRSIPLQCRVRSAVRVDQIKSYQSWNQLSYNKQLPVTLESEVMPSFTRLWYPVLSPSVKQPVSRLSKTPLAFRPRTYSYSTNRNRMFTAQPSKPRFLTVAIEKPEIRNYDDDDEDDDDDGDDGKDDEDDTQDDDDNDDGFVYEDIDDDDSD